MVVRLLRLLNDAERNGHKSNESSGRSFMNDSVLFNLPPLAGCCSDGVKP
jgi:hypothetical protein